MAPVLTKVFTPLATLMLLTLLVAMAWAGNGIGTGRELLIISDLLLVLVLVAARRGAPGRMARDALAAGYGVFVLGRYVDVTAPALLAMAKGIEARGAGDIAKRSLQTCGQIMRYAVAHGLIERNPAMSLDDFFLVVDPAKDDLIVSATLNICLLYTSPSPRD